MEKPKSKKQIRDELDQAVKAYLDQGGAIESIARGISGRHDNLNINHITPFTDGARSTRTLLTDTVKTIEERKHKKKPEPVKPRKPQKKIIYDDFGEPIREVWE